MHNRISIIKGQIPLLIIAPHGWHEDDLNTDIIAKTIAERLNGFAVINTGWKRAAKAKRNEGFANLNNLSHCKYQIEKEYLTPIIEFKECCIKKWNCLNIFIIHGMSDIKDAVDIVVGFGNGNPPSYSCNLTYKDRFLYFLKIIGFNIRQAKSGGRFSGWNTNNINQLFCRHYPDQRVQSLQIEIVKFRRETSHTANDTGCLLASAISNLIADKRQLPTKFFVEEY